MENIEFITSSNGDVFIRTEGNHFPFTQGNREIVSFILDDVRTKFPDTYKRLCNLYERYKGNVVAYEYMMARRFVRCNLGADDMLSWDVKDGSINLEYISCPLRGECKDEGVVCCPVKKSVLHPKQMEVARLYARGKRPTEIAAILKKSTSTVNKQLGQVCKSLGLRRVRDIITYSIIYNGI